MLKRGGWNDSQSLMIKPGRQGQVQPQASWEWPWLRSWSSWWRCPGLLPALVSALSESRWVPMASVAPAPIRPVEREAPGAGSSLCTDLSHPRWEQPTLHPHAMDLDLAPTSWCGR